ncbi:hypothetical protein [Hymenobacter edaphi]|uniref:Uncharacterized protein n=1 Tax=Hymenobacter edaphi TaxID=2211146 RepID=A0A328BW22_9BACT|nr:hypothetical protein [Hymenobacter edaphi]RAK70246.1 hypothetical protein DLM85_05200 [Hymenobacter edaphi]
MDEAYFLAIGFERWVSLLPLQTTMYVHRCPARDGARLYLSIPPTAAAESSAAARASLEARVERFFSKHGGRTPVALQRLTPVT